MIINAQNIRIVSTGFRTNFQNGLGMAADQWNQVATLVPSTTGEEKYGWLGKIPGLRKWLGDRVVHNLAVHDYTIVNEDWEDTVAVPRNAIKDDRYGVYGPMFTALGEAVGAHPNELVYALLKDGWTEPCYDGQNFFDADHPVLDAAGQPYSVSNSGGGSGAPWFLMDDSKPLKPIILQEREKPNLVRKDAANDDNVFWQKEFIYGVDCRRAVGFGFWQFVHGSKQALTDANYATARAALSGQKGDYGRPLGLVGRKLVVGPSNEGAARRVVKNAFKANGESNEWQDTAEVVMVPWLA